MIFLKLNVFCYVSESGIWGVGVVILVSLLRKGESHNQWHTLNTRVTSHTLLPQAETSGHCGCYLGCRVSLKVTPRSLPYL